MALEDLSRYIYGTTRLGDPTIPFANRVAVAQEAVKLGVWIHTSDQYGDALKVLNAAFDEDRSSVPPAIFKIGWSSVAEIRDQILSQTHALGTKSMAIGQLCLGEPLATDVVEGGPGVAGLASLRDEGLVGRFVLEVFPWTSSTALRLMRERKADGLIEGLIFYFNPLQRFATNELWEEVVDRNLSVIAMRTVAGGDIHRILENDKAPDYLRGRASAVAPIFERSGVPTWTEFAARFALSFSQVKATVGATSRIAALHEFKTAVDVATPLPRETVDEILALQQHWSNEQDIHAAPWSM